MNVGGNESKPWTTSPKNALKTKLKNPPTQTTNNRKYITTGENKTFFIARINCPVWGYIVNILIRRNIELHTNSV